MSNRNYIARELEAILLGRGISQVSLYQDFHISLVKNSSKNKYPPNIRIALCSKWYLNSIEWWNDFCSGFPKHSNQAHIQYEAIMAFTIVALREFDITGVNLLYDNSLEKHLN